MRNTWVAGGYPLTLLIIAINFITMVLITFRVPIVEWLVFVAPQQLSRPWTLLTYPLVASGIFEFLFHALWLYFIGASLERSWGTRFYGIYFFVLAVISALGITLGSFILQIPEGAENWLPIAALTVTFCALNPTMEIYVYGVVPVLARWLLIGELLIVFFLYAQRSVNPLMGFFALIGCAAAYLWTRTQIWGGPALYLSTRFAPRQPRAKTRDVPHDDAFSWRDLNPFERIARARRKKQFQRLFEDDDK